MLCYAIVVKKKATEAFYLYINASRTPKEEFDTANIVQTIHDNGIVDFYHTSVAILT